MDLWQKLAMELDSLKLSLQLTDNQKMLSKDMEFIKNYKKAHRSLDAIAMFARRAAEVVAELEKQGQVVRQSKWNDPIASENEEVGGHVLGNHTQIRFPSLNAEMEGKVDTGATTSSLHAEQIKVNNERGTVSFVSPEMSPNVMTLPIHGAQEVHSADHGGETRPVVKLDIEVNGKLLKDMLFNLNDRSGMDTHLLIGQNILKAGDFHVDVNKDEPQPEVQETTAPTTTLRDLSEHAELANAVELLRNQNVTFEELFRYLTTEALHKVESLES